MEGGSERNAVVTRYNEPPLSQRRKGNERDSLTFRTRRSHFSRVSLLLFAQHGHRAEFSDWITHTHRGQTHPANEKRPSAPAPPF